MRFSRSPIEKNALRYYYTRAEDIADSLRLLSSEVRKVVTDCLEFFSRSSAEFACAKLLWDEFRQNITAKYARDKKVRLPDVLKEHVVSSDEESSEEDTSEEEVSEEEVSEEESAESVSDESGHADSTESQESEEDSGDDTDSSEESESLDGSGSGTRSRRAGQVPPSNLPKGRFELLWKPSGKWVQSKIIDDDSYNGQVLVQFVDDATREWVAYSDMVEGTSWKPPQVPSKRGKSDTRQTLRPPKASSKDDNLARSLLRLSSKKCLFCSRSGLSNSNRRYLGSLVTIDAGSLFDKKSNAYRMLKAKKKTVFRAHARCLEWTPEMYQDDDGNWQELKSALTRSLMLRCAHPDCGSGGSALGCVCDDCKNTYHFGCALLTKPSPCAVNLDDWQIMCPTCQEKKSNRRLLKGFVEPDLAFLSEQTKAELSEEGEGASSDSGSAYDSDSDDSEPDAGKKTSRRKSASQYLFTAPTRDDDHFGSEDECWEDLSSDRERASVAAVRRLSKQVATLEQTGLSQTAPQDRPPTNLRDRPHPRIPPDTLPTFVFVYQFIQTNFEFLDMEPCHFSQLESALLSDQGENDYVIKLMTTLMNAVLPDFDAGINDCAADYVLDALQHRGQQPIVADLLSRRRVSRKRVLYSDADRALARDLDAFMDAQGAKAHDSQQLRLRRKQGSESTHPKRQIDADYPPNPHTRQGTRSVIFGQSYAELQAALKHKPFSNELAPAKPLVSTEPSSEGGNRKKSMPEQVELIRPVKPSFVPFDQMAFGFSSARDTKFEVKSELAASVNANVAQEFFAVVRPDWKVGLDTTRMCTEGATTKWAKMNWMASDEFPDFPLTLTAIAQQCCRQCHSRYQLVEKRCPHCEIETHSSESSLDDASTASVYTVAQGGETIEDIASKVGKSVEHIIACNLHLHGLTKRSKMSKGAKLRLAQPVGTSGKSLVALDTAPRKANDEWTKAEEDLILKARDQLGPDWDRIAELLPGRDANLVASHWDDVLRFKPREAASTHQSADKNVDDDDANGAPSPPATPPKSQTTYSISCPACKTSMTVEADSTIVVCANDNCRQKMRVSFETPSAGGGDNKDSSKKPDESYAPYGRRSRSTRKRKPVKHFTVSTEPSYYKRKRKHKKKNEPAAGAAGAIGAGGLAEIESENGKSSDPFLALALKHMCPKGVLIEEPYLQPKLHRAPFTWPEILRQYMCVKSGLPRTTFGPSAQAFTPKYEYVLLLLKRQQFADAFLQPVDTSLYADYTSIVKQPMDLDTIQHKVDDFQYSTPAQFVRDVRRVGFNALAYNAAGSPVAEQANELLAWFEPIAILLDMWHPAAAMLADQNPRNGLFGELMEADERSRDALEAVRSNLEAEPLLTRAEVAAMDVVSYKACMHTPVKEIHTSTASTYHQLREPSFLKLYMKCRVPSTIPPSRLAQRLGLVDEQTEEDFRYHHICVLMDLSSNQGKSHLHFLDPFKLDNEEVVPRCANPGAKQYLMPTYAMVHDLYQQPAWRRATAHGTPLMAPLTAPGEVHETIHMLGNVPFEKWAPRAKMTCIAWLIDRVRETTAFKSFVDRARRMNNLAEFAEDHDGQQALHFDGARCRSVGMLNASQALWIVGPGARTGPTAKPCGPNEATDIYEEPEESAQDDSPNFRDSDGNMDWAAAEHAHLLKKRCPHGSVRCRGPRYFSAGFVCVPCRTSDAQRTDRRSVLQGTKKVILAAMQDGNSEQRSKRATRSNAPPAPQATSNSGEATESDAVAPVANELVTEYQPTELLVQTFFENGSEMWTGFWSAADIIAVARSVQGQSRKIAGVRVGGKHMKRRLARWFLQPDSLAVLRSLQEKPLPSLAKSNWKPAMSLVELLDFEEQLYQSEVLEDRSTSNFHQQSEMQMAWSQRRGAWQASLVDILKAECGWSDEPHLNRNVDIIKCSVCSREIAIPPHVAPLLGIGNRSVVEPFPKASFKCSMADWQPFPIICQEPQWRTQQKVPSTSAAAKPSAARLGDETGLAPSLITSARSPVADVPSYLTSMSATVRSRYPQNHYDSLLPGAAQLLSLEMVIANNILTIYTNKALPYQHSQYWTNIRRTWRARVACATSFSQLTLAFLELQTFVSTTISAGHWSRVPMEYAFAPAFRQDPRVSEIRRSFLRDHVAPTNVTPPNPASKEAFGAAIWRRAVGRGWVLPTDDDAFDMSTTVTTGSNMRRLRFPRQCAAIMAKHNVPLPKQYASSTQPKLAPSAAPVKRTVSVAFNETAKSASRKRQPRTPSGASEVRRPHMKKDDAELLAKFPPFATKFETKRRFLESVHAFHPSLANDILMVGDGPLDLWKLYLVVESLGGCAQVEAGSKWEEVCRSCGISNVDPSTATKQLRKAFQKYLSQFETAPSTTAGNAAESGVQATNTTPEQQAKKAAAQDADARELIAPPINQAAALEANTSDIEVSGVGAGLGTFGDSPCSIHVGTVFADGGDCLWRIAYREGIAAEELGTLNKMPLFEGLKEFASVSLFSDSSVASPLLDPYHLLQPAPDDMFSIGFVGATPVMTMLLPRPSYRRGRVSKFPNLSSVHWSRSRPIKPLIASSLRRVVDYAVEKLNNKKVNGGIVR